MRRTVQSLATRSILFGMVIVCGTVLLTQNVKSFNPQPDPPKATAFGLMSLSDMQTLQANVVHLHNEARRAGANPPDDTAPVEIHVVGLRGQVLGSVRLRLPEGEGGFVHLNGADLMREHPELFGEDRRAQVRIEIHPPEPGKRVGGITPCIFPATVELFDNLTGQTMVVFENPVTAVSGIQPTPF